MRIFLPLRAPRRGLSRARGGAKMRRKVPDRYQLTVAAGFLLLACIVLLAVFGERGWLHLARLRQEKRTLEVRIFALTQESYDLRTRIRKLRTDDGFLEKVAREQLGLAAPGEIIYRYGNPSAPERAAAPPPPSSTSPPRAGWRRHGWVGRRPRNPRPPASPPAE